MFLGDCFCDSTMMIVFRPDDGDVETITCQAFDDFVQLGDKGARQVIDQIDTACRQILFLGFIQSVKPKHKPIAPAQLRGIAHH